ncbi:MAG: hypothetical protein ACT4P3_15520 [Betaproteobacteria bacterium]
MRSLAASVLIATALLVAGAAAASAAAAPGSGVSAVSPAPAPHHAVCLERSCESGAMAANAYAGPPSFGPAVRQALRRASSPAALGVHRASAHARVSLSILFRKLRE